MGNGKIVVIISTYGRAQNLPDIVESIKKQTYKNWRIFIADDRGTTDAEPIAKEIIANNPTLDIAYFKNSINLGEVPNLQAALVRNEGVGEFVVPFQDDCIYLDFEYFEKAVDALNQYKEANLIIGKIVNNGNPANSWQQNMLMPGVEMWRRWPIAMLWAGNIYRYNDFYEVMLKTPAKNRHFPDSIAILRCALRGGGGGAILLNSYVIETQYKKEKSFYAYLNDDPIDRMIKRELYYKELTEDARKAGVSEEEIAEWLLRSRYFIAFEALYAIKKQGDDEKKIDDWINALSKYDRNLTNALLKNFVTRVNFE